MNMYMRVVRTQAVIDTKIHSFTRRRIMYNSLSHRRRTDRLYTTYKQLYSILSLRCTHENSSNILIIFKIYSSSNSPKKSFEYLYYTRLTIHD